MSYHRRPDQSPPPARPIKDPWLHPFRALAVALAASVVGCAGLQAPMATGANGGVTTTPQYAISAVPAASIPDYERSAFGPAWADVDRNGCDTRNDILRRDLIDIATRPGTHDCVVISGTLRDPYSGTTVPFAKARAGDIQIDHVVPLSWAWEHGAYSWTTESREAFANDPLNLQATIGKLNAAKGDSGPDEWLPPAEAYTCAYLDRWMAIRTKYRLDPDFTLKCKR